jgi:peptide/nickel transport system substrate-binding protein
VVRHFGDLKKLETAIGTGPFILERYEPNVKTVFTRNPEYFRQGQPYVDGVEWLVLEDESTGLALYRTGHIDCGPWHWWAVRQQALEALKKSHPNLVYQDFVSNVLGVVFRRTDMPPCTDVRVQSAIFHAIDRQGSLSQWTSGRGKRWRRASRQFSAGRNPAIGFACSDGSYILGHDRVSHAETALHNAGLFLVTL